MKKIALFLVAPFMLSMSDAALAVTTESVREQSGFSLVGGGIQLSDRKLSNDLSGLAVQYQFKLSPETRLELGVNGAEDASQEYLRYHFEGGYQLFTLEQFKCECSVGVILRAGQEKYDGVFTDKHTLYGAGFYSRGELLPNVYTSTKFGYQDDNAEDPFTRRGWFLDYQISYELNRRADVYLNYQRQYDQHVAGLGINVRFF